MDLDQHVGGLGGGPAVIEGDHREIAQGSVVAGPRPAVDVVGLVDRRDQRRDPAPPPRRRAGIRSTARSDSSTPSRSPIPGREPVVLGGSAWATTTAADSTPRHSSFCRRAFPRYCRIPYRGGAAVKGCATPAGESPASPVVGKLQGTLFESVSPSHPDSPQASSSCGFSAGKLSGARRRGAAQWTGGRQSPAGPDAGQHRVDRHPGAGGDRRQPGPLRGRRAGRGRRRIPTCWPGSAPRPA